MEYDIYELLGIDPPQVESEEEYQQEVHEPFFLKYHQGYIEDEEQSRMMRKIMELRPHKSMVYTHDDIGTATLMADLFDDSVRYCPQDDTWYIWDGSRWARQTEGGIISDKVQTVLNLLLFYCTEITVTEGESEIKEYSKYCRSIRKSTALNSIISVLKTMVRISVTDFDNDPYLLNTPACAYNLKTMEVVPDRETRNITQVTGCNLVSLYKHCDRWYQFIDEIMSHNKEKAAFLQRALGYSLLGINKEECMFIAYGSKSRNGKGTLFSSIQTALGSEYMGGSDPRLICEAVNGHSMDFNTPQPALRKLVSTRLVNMSEIDRDHKIAAGSLKAMTGRDTLTTRGLYESSFDFIPQFSIWVNTNYLPAVNDDTVFKSDRIWVITFDESFTEDKRNRDLKEIFTAPENRPTILKWLVDGCADYFKQGLNPPECVRKATADYRLKNDRIGNFIQECCSVDDPESDVRRSELYSAYRSWCCKGENRYRPLGSTSFYTEMENRGYHQFRRSDGYCIKGISLN